MSLPAQVLQAEDHDQRFGFVREGDTVRITYKVRNTGTQPLKIERYDVECGCTLVTGPDGPLAPGESAEIKVTFLTEGKMDRQDRLVGVVSNNLGGPVNLRFRGVVLKKKK